MEIQILIGMNFLNKRNSFLPLSIAWQNLEVSNGCDSLEELRSMIMRYRKDSKENNPRIGCIILSDPIFFDKNDWLELPKDWSGNIVSGKSYSMYDGIGKICWEKVENLLKKLNFFERTKDENANMCEENMDHSIYYSEYLTRVRTGQKAFRVTILDAYLRKCSITGERTLPVLEAGHIKPFSKSGPHKVYNGILLRSDIHKLYDEGYITITPKYEVKVSKRIKQEYENGREYYKFQGKELVNLPSSKNDMPKEEYLKWHNENIYKN
ncbi:MAG: HNH endonuclease [Candidatus Firestonebacteria bacterium]